MLFALNASSGGTTGPVRLTDGVQNLIQGEKKEAIKCLNSIQLPKSGAARTQQLCVQARSGCTCAPDARVCSRAGDSLMNQPCSCGHGVASVRHQRKSSQSSGRNTTQENYAQGRDPHPGGALQSMCGSRRTNHFWIQYTWAHSKHERRQLKQVIKTNQQCSFHSSAMPTLR